MTDGSALAEIFAPPDLAVGDGNALALFLHEPRAAERFWDFFTANIRNRHTRRAYYNAVCKFAEFCAGRGVHDLAHVRPIHVTGYVEGLRDGFAKPTIKQHLAATRMLLDWLVVGQVIAMNPAHAVRGPRHIVKKGSTPLLNRDEARALLACIDVSTLTGVRDRALIAVMIYTFARISAVLQMNVGTTSVRAGADGCAYMRKAAKSMKHPASSSSKPTSVSIWQPPASRTTRRGRYGARQDASPARRTG
jgi:site-specific recombinase XerC